MRLHSYCPHSIIRRFTHSRHKRPMPFTHYGEAVIYSMQGGIARRTIPPGQRSTKSFLVTKPMRIGNFAYIFKLHCRCVLLRFLRLYFGNNLF